MNERQPTREDILRSQSGIPVTAEDGTVQWVRPSSEGYRPQPSNISNSGQRPTTGSASNNSNGPVEQYRPSTEGQQPSASWTTWASSASPQSPRQLQSNGGKIPPYTNTLRTETNDKQLKHISTSSEKTKDSDLESSPTTYQPDPAAHPAYQPADIDIEKQSFSQEHDSQRQQSDDSNDDDSDDKKDDEKEDKKDPNLVTWDGDDDPENPMNFKPAKKWSMALMFGLMTFVVTFASSVFSSATMVTAMQFGVSSEVMILAVSLFVLGFAFGPIVWGPFSELYGRKVPLFVGYFIFAIFQIPVATATNLQTIFICRFFGGFFAAAPLATVGGALADFFGPIDRGVAMVIFSASTFIGPVMGPILGGFITMSHLGWRWTAWLTMIMAALFGIIGFFVIDETFAPVLLQRRAKKLKYQTKNWALHAEADEKEVNLKEIADKYLLKPFKMLALEPILVLVTLYMSLIYGIIYGFFEVFPVTFQEERGYNLGVGSLPFLSVLVGVLCGSAIIVYVTRTRTARIFREQGGIVPEERLIPMIIGGALLPIGLFW